ncbi:hypothetical protein Uis4E_1743 [Bifidobacterium parmae]|uniref:Uncharacterized protein n=2 Tax=Bifidobacterium parmae TaxID=361854 RepID=A0A2N5IYX4_9BIFI|nr:hypothetical protein Uis4E_1743 [Bifidobacterium parmae]
MRMPKLSTLYMATAAMNALSTILEFAKEKRDNKVLLLRAVTTVNWITITIMQLRWERQEALEAAEDEEGGTPERIEA